MFIFSHDGFFCYGHLNTLLNYVVICRSNVNKASILSAEHEICVKFVTDMTCEVAIMLERFLLLAEKVDDYESVFCSQTLQESI